jgi:UDP-N-acetyl-D-mannosaminuronic acid dehydrogenase
VGGHCIAVDPWFIVDAAPREARLIRAAREVNDHKPHFVLGQIEAACRGRTNPIIACLGLAFKANVDDLRESPAMEITQHLAEKGADCVLVVEPHVTELPTALRGHVALVNLSEALARADVIVLLVAHRSFLAVDRALLAGKAVIDCCGAWRS